MKSVKSIKKPKKRKFTKSIITEQKRAKLEEEKQEQDDNALFKMVHQPYIPPSKSAVNKKKEDGDSSGDEYDIDGFEKIKI